jgi:pectinesterase
VGQDGILPRIGNPPSQRELDTTGRRVANPPQVTNLPHIGNLLHIGVRTVLLLAAAIASGRAEVVVAADGSGQFKTVQEAIDAAPANLHAAYVIRIKHGVYKEHIVVPHEKPFLTFLGDDPKTTVLTNDWYASMTGANGKAIGTFRTSSTTVQADDFSAENITFENSAGPKGQAVAFAIFADRGRFKNCRFLGWQDTLLAQSGRQYFAESYIEGAVDFIFGGSTAFFDRCQIHVRGNGYITAASTPKDQEYGYVFSHSKITAEPGVKTDLGRPWRDYGAVAFLNTEMADVVRPAGWNNWQKPERESTARYSEFRSTGPGGDMKARVAWAHTLTDADAQKLTVRNVLSGTDEWDPKVGKVKETGKFKAALWKNPSPLRDPGSVRGPDGVLHQVWAMKGNALAVDGKRLDPMAGKNALSLENPSIFYSDLSNEFVITWASTITENYFQSYQEPVEDNPRLWYTTTSDFKTFAPAKVFFEPGYTVRYAVILKDGPRYALLHEDSRQSMAQLRVSFAASLLGPWGAASETLGVGAPERVKIALVGDSTVAEGGGWGPGFRDSFGPEVEVLNFARNGRSSKSFRDEGLWTPAVESQASYVLIQFGHNDVPGKGADRETDPTTTFRANMGRFADEARAAGAIPVFVTSIVRRNLTADGKVQSDSLAPYVAELRKLAQDKHVLLMDMNALTLQQCEKLGPSGCHELDARDGEKPDSPKNDTTHLGAKGQREVGAIAAREFLRIVFPGQNSPDPKTVTANSLLPLNRSRSTFGMPEPADTKLPTLFILGDSTVRNGHGVGASGLWGWGEPVARYFDTSKINVVNRAIGGLSSRTFVTQGHWARVLALLKRGDFVMMQFGHNDASPINDPTRARGSIKGVGEESTEIFNQMIGEAETVHTYGWYLRKMISEAQARGATVVVCSPVPRQRWKDGHIVRTSDYSQWAEAAARDRGVMFVNLNELAALRYEKLGQTAVAKLFPSDNTHTNRDGAEILASAVAEGLAPTPLAPFLTGTRGRR